MKNKKAPHNKKETNCRKEHMKNNNSKPVKHEFYGHSQGTWE